jgi:4-carboxymuconolactone decarboxylase
MTDSSSRTKLPRLPESDWEEEHRSAFQEARTRPEHGQSILVSMGKIPGSPQNEWTDILVRHPDLLVTWSKFSHQLLYAGSLPEALRELAILRISWLTQASYEWAAHTHYAAAVGLAEEQIPRVPEGAAAPGWSAIEENVLKAVDQLYFDARISDDTWGELAKTMTDAELIELPFLVGHYQMLAYCLNSLGVFVEGMPPR